MTIIQQLISIIDGLDDKGPDYLQVREAQKLANNLRAEAGK
jgi:hypothetical protein